MVEGGLTWMYLGLHLRLTLSRCDSRLVKAMHSGYVEELLLLILRSVDSIFTAVFIAKMFSWLTATYSFLQYNASRIYTS